MKTIIFDFDGTIVDSKHLYYTALVSELRGFGFKENQVDRAIDMGMSLRKTFSRLGFNAIYSYFLKRRIMGRIEKYISNVKKCRDADSIGHIKGRRILVTNSLKEFVLPVLKHLKLGKYFDEVYGADDFLDKGDFIAEYIKKNGLKKDECFYVGDRATDARLARKVGCVSIIVSGKCAWNPRSEIMKENPDFIVDDLKDIGKIVE
jgi:HAD superfamily hydrolase (TIGR01549 family)